MYADMPALLAAACANKVDVVMNLGESAERARCLRFSNAYFDANVAIVGRKGAVGQQAVALERARIAVEPGFIMDERLRARFPSARFESVKDTEDGLRAVSAGKADYYPTMQPVADYYLGRPEFKGAGRAGKLPGARWWPAFRVQSGRRNLARRRQPRTCHDAARRTARRHWALGDASSSRRHPQASSF
jgi:ABC-type amino acid transport substrate-binding protein